MGRDPIGEASGELLERHWRAEEPQLLLGEGLAADLQQQGAVDLLDLVSCPRLFWLEVVAAATASSVLACSPSPSSGGRSSRLRFGTAVDLGMQTTTLQRYRDRMQRTSVTVPDLDSEVPPRSPGPAATVASASTREPWEGRDEDVAANRAGRFSQNPRIFAYGPHPEVVDVVTWLSAAFVVGGALLWAMDSEHETVVAVAQPVIGVAAVVLLIVRLLPVLWPLPKPKVEVITDGYHLESETITNPHDDTTTTIRVLRGLRSRQVLPFTLPFADFAPFAAEVCTASWKGQTRLLWMRVTRPPSRPRASSSTPGVQGLRDASEDA